MCKMINTDFRYELEKIPSLKQSDGPNNAVNELNGFFISHFLKLMYDTVEVMSSNESGFSDGSGEKIFREFLLNEYGKEMSSKFQLTNEMMGRYFSNTNILDTTLDIST